MRGGFRAAFSPILVILLAVPSCIAAAPAGEPQLLAADRQDSQRSAMPAGWYIDDVRVIADTLHTLVYEGFESGAPNWTHNGTVDDWQMGQPGGDVGPAAAYAGANCAGTNLTGPYSRLDDCYLASPVFNLSMAFSAGISFYSWLELGPGDHANVSLEAERYGVWRESDPIEIPAGTSWTQRTIDFSQFMTAGNQFESVGCEQVRFKFRLESGVRLSLSAQAGNRHVKLDWMPGRPPAGDTVAGYDVYRGVSPASMVKLAPAGNVTEYNDTAVVNGNKYYYRVTEVLSSGGAGNSSNIVDATPLALPGPPRDPCLEAGVGFLNLSWKVPADDGGYNITAYWVYRCVDVAWNLQKLAKLGNVLDFGDVNVTFGTTYFYAVSAVNDMGEGPRCQAVNGSPGRMPSPPRNLTARAEGFVIHLAWEPPADAGGSLVRGYAVYRWNGTGPWTRVYECAGTVQDDQLETSEREVFYAVAAINEFGESAACGLVTLYCPTPPRELDVAHGPDGMRLSWTAPWSDGGCPVVTYYTYRSLDGNAWEFLASTPDNQTVWTDTGVQYDPRIAYKVSAVNAVGESPPCSSGSVAADRTVPEITIDRPSTDIIYSNATVVFSGMAMDPVGIRSVMVLGPDGWVICEGTMSWRACVTLREGTQQVQIKAIDLADNAKTMSISVRVDLTPPVLQFEYPAEGAILTQAQIDVFGRVNDDSPIESIELSIDGVAWVSARGADHWTCRLTLKNGPNRIYLRAEDVADHSNASSIAVTLDSGPPSLIITSPRPSQRFTSGRQITVEGRSSDDTGVAGVDMSVDGGLWTPANGTTTWSHATSVGTGVHRIRVRATDLAGRVNELEVTIMVQGGQVFGAGMFWPSAALAAILVVVAAIAIAVTRSRKR